MPFYQVMNQIFMIYKYNQNNKWPLFIVYILYMIVHRLTIIAV